MLIPQSTKWMWIKYFFVYNYFWWLFLCYNNIIIKPEIRNVFCNEKNPNFHYTKTDLNRKKKCLQQVTGKSHRLNKFKRDPAYINRGKLLPELGKAKWANRVKSRIVTKLA